MLLLTEHLQRYYTTGDVVTKALQDVSFCINKGEFVAIMGPSGSGKSTLMHILSFLDRPTGGVYKYKGNDVTKFSDTELARLRNEEIGFVFQSFNLLSRTTVFDNIMLPLIYSQKITSRKERKKQVEKTIEAVGLTKRIYHLKIRRNGKSI